MATAGNYKYHNPRKLAIIVLVCIAIDIIFNILMILFPVGDDSFVYLAEVIDEAKDNNEALMFGLCIATCIVLVFVIPFFIWVYRTCANAWALGSNMKNTPSWAVGWFFIPILNIVRAPQALQEIWKGSDPQSPEVTRPTTIFGWSYQITGWWFFMITSHILDFFAYNSPWTAPLTIPAVHFFSLISLIFMVFIIRQITGWQEEKYELSLTIQ